MSKTQFEHLFTPLQVGPMRVPNRICETTNTINSSMIPGEIEYRSSVKRKEYGIPLSQVLYDELISLGKDLGISVSLSKL